jgi:hypothetical protein
MAIVDVASKVGDGRSAFRKPTPSPLRTTAEAHIACSCVSTASELSHLYFANKHFVAKQAFLRRQI